MSISNKEIGRQLGVSHAQISRIKSGDRLPSLQTMLRIQETLGWSLADQAVLHQQADRSEYAAEFNRRIAEAERQAEQLAALA